MAASCDESMGETHDVSNLSAFDSFPFDVYTGSNIGFLKGCLYSNKKVVNVNKVLTPDKGLDVTCLSWGPDESTVLAGCRNGTVTCYHFPSRTVSELSINAPSSSGILKTLRCHSNNVITAFGSGSVRVHTLNQPPWTVDGDCAAPESDDEEHSEIEIEAGKDLYCMDHSRALPHLIATGGKENPLKLWDVNVGSSGTPVFTAKNVKNDWLNLRVPVWNTAVKFLSDGKKVVIGTGNSLLRLYDSSSQQRRPVLEMKYEDSPITAVAIKPGTEHHYLLGNTLGNVAILDLRKKAIVKSFKGTRGGITDMQFRPNSSCFACCSVDRFLYFYDSDGVKAPLKTVYANSSLNCLLVSSQWSALETDGKVNTEHDALKVKTVGDDNVDSGNEVLVNSDDDDVWEGMEVVKTTKRKKVEKSVPASKTKKKKQKSQ